jgi:hypothetical protein
MNPDEYLEISSKLSDILTTLEDVETVLIDRFGARCHAAVRSRLTSCVLVLTSLKLSQEYNDRFDNDQGGWSLTD